MNRSQTEESKISQHIWNIHNYSKPSQPNHLEPPQSKTCQAPQNAHGPTSEVPTGFNNKFAMPPPNVIPQKLPKRSCIYLENEAMRSRLEQTTWRENASIEDWKAYLYSAPPSTSIMQVPQVQYRQMTPCSYNVQYSGNNPNTRRFRPDQSQINMQYHQPINGSFKTAVNDIRNRVLVSAADNRRVAAGRSQAINSRQTDSYQNRSEQKRGRGRSQYYNFSPDLIRYLDPSQLDREQPFSELDYVESLMCNPNEKGYVTLDDKALDILVSAIDQALPKNLNLELLAESVHIKF